MSGGFDFDSVVDRAGSDSVKWGRYAGRDITPLWVADMDFAVPPPVLAALQTRVAHGVFGYNAPTAAQNNAVIAHLQREYDWPVEGEWIVWLPGLVSGLNVSCRAVGEPGDAVFTAMPIYPPFLSSPKFSERRVVTAPLLQADDVWQWDFAAVDGVLRDSHARLLLLCHPHNPVGRAWHDDELWQIAALAEKHDLVVCSDEIHCGLLLTPGLRHHPLASLAPEIARRTVTLMAPSKTFNIPGLGCAFAIISDPALRRRFCTAMQGIVPHVNVLGMAATEAALTECGDWHAALLDYLRGNARRVECAVNALDGLSMTPVEATYLAWIDAREFARMRQLTAPGALVRHFEGHGLGLSEGADFGVTGFLRLNFGTRRALLDQSLQRLQRAVQAQSWP